MISNQNGLRGLAHSWAVQRRVLGALLMRETLTRYGRHNIGFLWMFVEPMLFTVGVTLLWNALKTVHGSNLPITAFGITGYSSVLIWRNMPSRAIGAITPNLSLMYHRNVKILDIFLSRILLEFMGVLTSCLILTLFFSAIEWMTLPEDIIKVVEGLFMLGWFGASLAILIGALSHDNELVDKFWHPFVYLFFPFSGAAFLIDAAPAGARSFILWVPMVHGVECVRDGYFGSMFTPHYDLGYLAMWNITLTLVALLQVRKLNYRIIPQ